LNETLKKFFRPYPPPSWLNPFLRVLVDIATSLADIARSFKQFNESLSRMEKKIMATLDTVAEDLTANTSAVGSAVLLLGTLAQEVHDLKGAQTDPVTAAKIDALDEKIRANTDALAAAVAANTESAAPAPSLPLDGGGTDNVA